MSRRLSLAERVEAQRAIERAYFQHQIGGDKAFERAITDELLERKVRTYLKQSAALERFWGTPITADALRAELARISRDTQSPGRLRDLFKALGDDPFLIQECLVRASLVDRLARGFFSKDERFHEAARGEAESLRRGLELGELSAAMAHPRRTVLELRRVRSALPVGSGSSFSRGPGAGPEGEITLELDEEEFKARRSRAPRDVGAPGPVMEEHDAFVVSLVLEQEKDRARIATYSVPKTTWDEWWSRAQDDLDETSVVEVAAPSVLPSELRGPADSKGPGGPAFEAKSAGAASAAFPCTTGAAWAPSEYKGPPTGRFKHTVVWTGTHAIFWGGYDGDYAGTGARYDPLTDTWMPISTAGAPSPRYYHTAVWSGSAMLVWGGFGGTYRNDGGSYDPVSDKWKPISTTGAPSARYGHTAVWTGTEMVVWGGADGTLLTTGGRYEPVTDTWAPLTSAGAPNGRVVHTAIWTGTEMIVWGGSDGTYRNDGARYDPVADTWAPVQKLGQVPPARYAHSAVWTGEWMVIWGGRGSGNTSLSTGSRYNPATDAWSQVSSIGAPAARDGHASVWTGSRMLVWGGSSLDSGGQYEPVADTWLPTSALNAPSRRHEPSGVWTGSSLVVWGGEDSTGFLDTGGRYDPATDIWTPTSVPPHASPRGGEIFPPEAAVWTGSAMIFWDAGNGWRYDPTLDSWKPTSSAGAPSTRENHTAVWTGDRVIVWGGDYFGGSLNTGAAYDPASDSWTQITSTGAPGPRSGHTALWTGDSMLVWGGGDPPSLNDLSTGGRYDAGTGTWSAIATGGAPSARSGHTAVWSGDSMIVWGGASGSTALSTGGTYDPGTNTWGAIATGGAPSARSGHTAVWSGDSMIVWGGSSGSTALSTGGAYDPDTNTWGAITTAGAPSARFGHTAVWTGRDMMVWGGGAALPVASGGLYDPAADAWTDVPAAGAPPAYWTHGAVWTGTELLVWVPDLLGHFGRLAVVPDDDDGDGYSVCDGDCDDRDGSIHPAASELCDNLDNDCDGSRDSFVTMCGTPGCPSAGFCSGGIDSCQPTVCGFGITGPPRGRIPNIPPELPPTFTWDPGPYNQFRVYVSWNPAFTRKQRIESGDALLLLNYWTPTLKQWTKVHTGALKSSQTIYVKVLGKLRGDTTVAYTEIVPFTVSLLRITSPSGDGRYFTGDNTIDLGGKAAKSVALREVRWRSDRSGATGRATGTARWAVSGVPLECGANRITVTGTNSAGVSGDDSIVAQYDSPECADTVPPTVAIALPTADPTWETTSSSIAMAGTAFDNTAAVTRVEWSNDRGGNGTAGGTTSWAIPAIPLECGLNTVTVAAEDDTGNHRAATLAVNYVSPACVTPTVRITTPTSAPTYLTYVSPLTLGGTATDNLGLASVAWSNARNRASGAATGTSSWTAAGIPLACGLNVIEVAATDTHGNSGGDAIAVTYQCVDNIVPSITITSPTTNQTLNTCGSSVGLAGTASDNVSVQSVTWSNNRGGSGTAAGTTNWTVSGIQLLGGVNSLTVSAHDPTGNIGVDSLAVTWDNVSPTVSIGSPTTSSTWAANTVSNLSIGGSASDNVGVQSVTWSNSRGGSGTAGGTTSWSASIALQCGTNILTVRAHDACGNPVGQDSLTVVPLLTYSSGSSTTKPIFDTKCVGCHSTFNNYSGVYANRTQIRCRLAGSSCGTTMRNYAGAADADKIIAWIDQCAPQ